MSEYPKKKTYVIVSIGIGFFLWGGVMMDAGRHWFGTGCILVGFLVAMAGMCGDL